MQPWIIERIQRQREEREAREQIQPRLPMPEPYTQQSERIYDIPSSGSIIVDFEL